MNVSIGFDGWVSFFDFVMLVLIGVGAYRGFAQGVIVQSISLFTLVVGLTICVNISKQVYRFLSPRSDVPDLFAMVVMAILFVGAIYLTMNISGRVSRHIADVQKGFTNRALGAVFGGIKYFFIAAVYLVTLFKVEDHAQFLPQSAKTSRLSAASIWMVTKIFPYLRMDKKDYRPFEHPTNNENQ